MTAAADPASAGLLGRSESSPILPSGEEEGDWECGSSAASRLGLTQQISTRAAATATTAIQVENHPGRNVRCDDDKVIAGGELAWCVSSRPRPPALCASAERSHPTVAAVGLSDSPYGDGSSRRKRPEATDTCSGSDRRQGRPISSNKPDHKSGGVVLARDNTEANPERNATTSCCVPDGSPGKRGDSFIQAKQQIVLPTVAPEKSSAVSVTLSNRSCRPTRSGREFSRKPRRDSFSASLLAAQRASSLSVPRRRLRSLQDQFGGGKDGTPTFATKTAGEAMQLTLPVVRHRYSVVGERPTVSSGASPVSTKQDDALPIRERRAYSQDSENVGLAQDAAAVPRQHKNASARLKVCGTMPCSEWIHDEDWLEVCAETVRTTAGLCFTLAVGWTGKSFDTT